jgi:RHS repeat-associated protein
VIAQRENGGLTYLYADHLGSVSVASTEGGALLSKQDFTPWGEIRSGGINQTTLNYTGQRRDGTGLLYYHARYYDPGLARFLSADTEIPSVEEPQFFNRYSYVSNNPLRFIDPTGHCRVKNGEFEYAEDCTADEFDALSYDHRIRWVRMFADKYKLTGWFDDIIGAIRYLRDDKDFSKSAWASYADAVVVQAIQNGMRLRLGLAAIGLSTGSKCNSSCLLGAAGWLAFYNSEAGLRRGRGSIQTVIRIRILAEQAGVEYAWKSARPLYSKESLRVQIKIDVLKWSTDQYRAAAFASANDPRNFFGRNASKLGFLIDATATAIWSQYLERKYR